MSKKKCYMDDGDELGLSKDGKLISNELIDKRKGKERSFDCKLY